MFRALRNFITFAAELQADMQVIFEDKDLEQLIMTAVADTKALSAFSYLHYEKLRGVDVSSVRVMNNRIERVLFRETADGIVITIIDLDDTHYGNKK